MGPYPPLQTPCNRKAKQTLGELGMALTGNAFSDPYLLRVPMAGDAIQLPMSRLGHGVDSGESP